jgi:NNP family nitrate/nitrite transporter-like MFS transporter
MGNGSVFQLVPQRFQKEIGVMTGVVGAAGGLGGFFLPTVLGSLKRMTGSFGPGFLSFALSGVVCTGALLLLRTAWERSFLGKGGKAVADPSAALAPVETPAVASDSGIVTTGEVVPASSPAN